MTTTHSLLASAGAEGLERFSAIRKVKSRVYFRYEALAHPSKAFARSTNPVFGSASQQPVSDRGPRSTSRTSSGQRASPLPDNRYFQGNQCRPTQATRRPHRCGNQTGCGSRWDYLTARTAQTCARNKSEARGSERRWNPRSHPPGLGYQSRMRSYWKLPRLGLPTGREEPPKNLRFWKLPASRRNFRNPRRFSRYRTHRA